MDIALLAALGLLCLLVLAVLLRQPRGGAAEAAADRMAGELDRLNTGLARLEGAHQAQVQAVETKLQGLERGVAAELATVRRAVDEGLARALEESRAGRTELVGAFSPFRTEVANQLGTSATALREQLADNGQQTRTQLGLIQDSVAQRLATLEQAGREHAEQLRQALNERLAAIQQDNATRLEEMRRTVDEKLQATLEQRLGESFRLVSERLEEVHRGLGDMRNLATGVGDLKRVLTNVRTRGTWGEVQLEALMGQILVPAQYERNVATRPGSSERVEFAVRLPGPERDRPVWLPIDAKFPMEDYQRLLEAHERGDAVQVDASAQALEVRIRTEARTIREKYVAPPHTTDFAVLYLPTEGLYAEVLRRPGLAEALQQDLRIVLCGPTNLAALLNSLQMGFRTLAIEQRSAEVWTMLGAVKTEFGRFGEVVEATRRKLDQAARQFDKVDVRTRAIQRSLRGVEALPGPEAAGLLGSDEIGGDDPPDDPVGRAPDEAD